jgi:predicted acyl esterase
MKLILRILFILLPIGAISQNRDSIWIKNNYKKIEKYVTARDGVRLFTSIYLPKDTLEKHPILLTRTPYSCAPYGEANFRDYWNIFYKEYFKEKYIVVLQDVRGRWMSEGYFCRCTSLQSC